MQVKEQDKESKAHKQQRVRGAKKTIMEYNAM